VDGDTSAAQAETVADQTIGPLKRKNSEEQEATDQPEAVFATVSSVSKSLPEAADKAEAQLLLTVHDQQGRKVNFRIKRSTPLRKLMDAYCDHVGSQASGLRFTVLGERLQPHYTAELLRLESEDVIDVTLVLTDIDTAASRLDR
jgi:small ubiquitin-related modifier